MPDMLSTMREFRFLEDKRSAGGLSESEEGRWRELSTLLQGEDAGSAPPAAEPAQYDPVAYAQSLIAQGYDPVQSFLHVGFTLDQIAAAGYDVSGFQQAQAAGWDPAAYAAQLIAQGYDPAQAYVAAGLSPDGAAAAPAASGPMPQPEEALAGAASIVPESAGPEASPAPQAIGEVELVDAELVDAELVDEAATSADPSGGWTATSPAAAAPPVEPLPSPELDAWRTPPPEPEPLPAPVAVPQVDLSAPPSLQVDAGADWSLAPVDSPVEAPAEPAPAEMAPMVAGESFEIEPGRFAEAEPAAAAEPDPEPQMELASAADFIATAGTVNGGLDPAATVAPEPQMELVSAAEFIPTATEVNSGGGAAFVEAEPLPEIGVAGDAGPAPEASPAPVAAEQAWPSRSELSEWSSPDRPEYVAWSQQGGVEAFPEVPPVAELGAPPDVPVEQEAVGPAPGDDLFGRPGAWSAEPEASPAADWEAPAPSPFAAGALAPASPFDPAPLPTAEVVLEATDMAEPVVEGQPVIEAEPAIEDASIVVEEEAPVAAPSPAPAAEVIAGEHRVIVHLVEGAVKRGAVRDLDLGASAISLLGQGGVLENIKSERVRAIFFMLPPGAPAPAGQGTKLRVTFHDGRQVVGFTEQYDPSAGGFFVVPADARTNTERIYIFRAAVRAVAQG